MGGYPGKVWPRPQVSKQLLFKIFFAYESWTRGCYDELDFGETNFRTFGWFDFENGMFFIFGHPPNVVAV